MQAAAPEPGSGGADLILKYFDGFSELQLSQLRRLKDLYVEWNAKINVVSRKDIEELYERHVLHSLAIAAVFSFPDGVSILDVGCGGGFPGLPLAIFFPKVRFVLVDSIGKKIQVVQAVASALGLANIDARNTRVQSIKKEEKFDFVVSRAVTELEDLWSWIKDRFRHGLHSMQVPVPMKLSAAETPVGTRSVARVQSGLITLKGGLSRLEEEVSRAQQRHRSVLDPWFFPIDQLFPDEPFFQEKCVLYQPSQSLSVLPLPPAPPPPPPPASSSSGKR